VESDQYRLYAIIIPLLILVSTYLSSVRAAFFSLSEHDYNLLKEKGTKSAARVLRLLASIKRLYVSLKIGASCIHFLLLYFTVLCSSKIAVDYALQLEWTIILTMTALFILLFLFRELLAASLVERRRVSFAQQASLPMELYCRLLSPVSGIAIKMLDFLSERVGTERFHSIFANVKLMTLMEEREQISGLAEDEREMIYSIYEFGETEVYEVMTPRTDIVSVEEKADIEQLAKLMKQKGHSRIPLYRDDIDNILGIVHVKDILPYMINGHDALPSLKEICRPAYFVPEGKRLRDLLKEFQVEKHHMAIVVDEYGGTAGLVTLEDVIEEIVGDIQDEYDQEPPLYYQIDDKTWSVDAKIDLHDLNDALHFELPTEGEYESLGGFILSITGHIPEERELVKFNNYLFTIERVVRNRIIRVKVTQNPQSFSEEEQSRDEESNGEK